MRGPVVLGRVDGRGVVTEYIAVTIDDMVELAEDVGAFKLPVATWSKLGVKQAVVGYVPSNGYAKIVGCYGTGTMSSVCPSDAFGYIVYGGTTLNGYSGAGYYCDRKLIGIHLHGGSVNGGMDASFVWVRLKRALNNNDEAGDGDSSAKFLEDQFKPGKGYGEDDLPDLCPTSGLGNVNEGWVEMRIKGRYMEMSEEALERVFGEDYADLLNSRSRRKEWVAKRNPRSVAYLGESAVPSGEAIAAGPSHGVSSDADQSVALEIRNPGSLIREYSKLSRSQKEWFRKQLSLPEEPMAGLSTQPVIPQQKRN